MFLINPYILQASGDTLWNDLLAYYTSDNTPNDSLGTYNGTLTNGATYGTGIINQGFSLDGVNDYVNCGNIPVTDGSTPFSVSAWVNSNDVTNIGFIYGKGSTSQLSLFFNSGYLYANIAQSFSSNELRVVTNNTFTTSTWYNIVVTYDGLKSATSFKIYVNNVNQSLTTVFNTFTGTNTNSSSFNLGSQANQYYFDGTIDEVAIWNRELTASEVTDLYNSGSGLQY